MVKFKIKEEALHCIFSGRLDTENAGKDEVEIESQKKQLEDMAIVFDLEAVEYVASAFLRTCIKTAKEKGHKFSVRHMKPNVTKVFKIAGIDKVILIDKDE